MIEFQREEKPDRFYRDTDTGTEYVVRTVRARVPRTQAEDTRHYKIQAAQLEGGTIALFNDEPLVTEWHGLGIPYSKLEQGRMSREDLVERHRLKAIERLINYRQAITDDDTPEQAGSLLDDYSEEPP